MKRIICREDEAVLQQQQHFPAWIKDVHPARLDKQTNRQTNVHPIMLDKPTICIRTKNENREQSLKKNIARIGNAVPVTLYSRVTMEMLILLFSIVRCVISV